MPLILAAWWDTSAIEKINRLAEHINYAAMYGILDEIDLFLRNLKPDEWAYDDGTTEWKAYK